MIKEIVTDSFLLSQKAKPATENDIEVVEDLLDTIKAHQENCVGMAANMIGVNKSIIVIKDGKDYTVMINPEIMKFSGQKYQTEEACLSLPQRKPTSRYEKVKVSYLDEKFKKKIKTYIGFTAQIIQHEIDHCQGILI